MKRAVAALVTVAGLALIVLATRSGRTRDIARHGTPYHVRLAPQPPRRQPVQASKTPNANQRGSLPGWLGDLLLAVGIAIALVVVALIVWYVVAFLRRVSLPHRERRSRPGEFDEAPADVAEALSQAVDDVLVEIERGETRDAIIACWLRLEDVAAAAGVARRAAETSTELTERVLATFQVNAAALARLAALYREARFSAHPMPDAARDEARSAFERVRQDVTAGAAP